MDQASRVALVILLEVSTRVGSRMQLVFCRGMVQLVQGLPCRSQFRHVDGDGVDRRRGRYCHGRIGEGQQGEERLVVLVG